MAVVDWAGSGDGKTTASAKDRRKDERFMRSLYHKALTAVCQEGRAGPLPKHSRPDPCYGSLFARHSNSVRFEPLILYSDPMSTARGKSFLTDIECDVQRVASQSTTYYEGEPVCGAYALTDGVRFLLDQNIPDKRRVAYALATRKARGSRRAIFVVDDAETVAVLAARQTSWTFLSVDELVKETSTSPLGMLDAALLNLTRELDHPSELARVATQDCWRLLAFNADSLSYVVKQLCDLGFIKDAGSDPSTSYNVRRFEVQSRGWEKIASLQTVEHSVKRQAFVAMWFDSQMEVVYQDAIKPAVEFDGTICVRIDLKEHNNKICDEIIAEIRRSKYVVADFSGNRGGVYYEAGFAFGLGRPVIWTVRKSDLSQIHFDTRQYNHLVYETTDELRTKLSNRIKATII